MTSTMVFISTKMLLTVSAVAQCLRYKRANSFAMRLMMVPSPDPQRFETTVSAFITPRDTTSICPCIDASYTEMHGASTEWKRSDARDVTAWFEEQNSSQSPDNDNGRQLRRIVREIKKFARSRESWKGQILSGFGITKLVTECYCGNANREDMALHDTMKALHERLDWSLEIDHPVTPNETITKDAKDARARFLRDRLAEAINTLAPLLEPDCTRLKALKCWDRIFATTFFSERSDIAAKAAPSLLRAPLSGGIPAAPFTFPNAPRVDDKPRGFG
jgi:hypothetical protein